MYYSPFTIDSDFPTVSPDVPSRIKTQADLQSAKKENS